MNRIMLFSMITLSFLPACNGTDELTISATGTIEATEVTVSAQAGGVVRRLVRDEGAEVHSGDTLLVIDDADWHLQFRQADAGYAMARAQYDLALRGARSEDISQAEASYENAKADQERMESLIRTSSIPQKQLDDARTRFTLAQQSLEKLRRGSRPEELAAARARMEQARAQRDALQKRIDDCTVIAPLGGTVLKRFVEAGELAGTGSPLMRIADLREMEMTIYVSEKDLPRIAVGQSAEARIDAFPGRAFSARVVFISSVAEFTPKNIQTADERTKLVFAVKLKLTNPDGALKAGIPADVTIVSAIK